MSKADADSQISNQGGSALAHMINADMGKTIYRAGERLHMPANTLELLNQDELRAGLHLPLGATDSQLDQVIAANNEAALPKSWHLPADASDVDVSKAYNVMLNNIIGEHKQ